MMMGTFRYLLFFLFAEYHVLQTIDNMSIEFYKCLICIFLTRIIDVINQNNLFCVNC